MDTTCKKEESTRKVGVIANERFQNDKETNPSNRARAGLIRCLQRDTRIGQKFMGDHNSKRGVGVRTGNMGLMPDAIGVFRTVIPFGASGVVGFPYDKYKQREDGSGFTGAPQKSNTNLLKTGTPIPSEPIDKLKEQPTLISEELIKLYQESLEQLVESLQGIEDETAPSCEEEGIAQTVIEHTESELPDGVHLLELDLDAMVHGRNKPSDFGEWRTEDGALLFPGLDLDKIKREFAELYQFDGTPSLPSPPSAVEAHQSTMEYCPEETSPDFKHLEFLTGELTHHETQELARNLERNIVGLVTHLAGSARNRGKESYPLTKREKFTVIVQEEIRSRIELTDYSITPFLETLQGNMEGLANSADDDQPWPPWYTLEFIDGELQLRILSMAPWGGVQNRDGVPPSGNGDH